MIGITEISAVVAAVGVLIGVVYYILDMRNQSRIRKTDLLIRLYLTYTSNEFMDATWKVMSLKVKDYQDYVKQYGSLSETDSQMNRAVFLIIGFYELVGVLLYRKLIDLVTVHDTFGTTHTIRLYGKIKPMVVEIREVESAALLGFEYLCHELKKEEPQLKKEFMKLRRDLNIYNEMKKREQRK
jgi:hypothetical protein